MEKIKLNCIERPQVNNEAIVYINGKLIIRNEWNELYYLECEDFIADQMMHEVIPPQDISSVTDLSEDEIDVIVQKCNELNSLLKVGRLDD